MEKLLKLFILIIAFSISIIAQNSFIRINQIGYLPNESKKAILISKNEINDKFLLIDSNTKQIVFKEKLKPIPNSNWESPFQFTLELDFSAFKQPARLAAGRVRSFVKNAPLAMAAK